MTMAPTTVLKLVAMLALLNATSAGSIREKRSFNSGWKFHLGATPNFQNHHLVEIPPCTQPHFDDSKWRELSVPHDFVVEGKFTPSAVASHGFLPTDAAWHRKTFSLPTDWDLDFFTMWIEFDGIYRASDIYLNGRLLAHHESGYTSFQVRLPKEITKGAENVLAVYCDSREQEGWWYEGGGIYRHVWLHRVANVHIPLYGVYAPTLVTGPISDQGRKAAFAEMRAEIEVLNMLAKPVSVSVATEVFPAQVTQESKQGRGEETSGRRREGVQDSRLSLTSKALHGRAMQILAGGRQIKTTLTVQPNETVSVAMWYEMRDKAVLSLWSPEQPAMYSLRAIIADAASGAILDVMEVRFGIRKVEFDAARGFFLNGESRQIKGMCNHQDFGGAGTAVPMGLQRFRIRRLQECGVDAWRMSHNPPNPELLDMLDEEGMMVWNENRNFGNFSQWLVDFVDFLRRDRNHPSVLLWSICNEGRVRYAMSGAEMVCGGCNEWRDHEAADDAKLFKALIHKHDPYGQRPMTAAMNFQWGKGVSRVIDVQGINYGYYQYDDYHTLHPTQPLIGSETASCTTDRGVYVGAEGYTSAYPSLRGRGCELHVDAQNQTSFQCKGTSCLEGWMIPTYTKEWVAGGFGWTGFDYKGEPTPDLWPTVNSHYGAVLDMMGLRKDAFWYYKAWWKPQDRVIHILPHWNWDPPHAFPNATIPVWVYTNAVSVRLVLNGKWITPPYTVTQFRYAKFDVPYAPGTLEAVGFGAEGEKWARTAVVTSGSPARLVASLLWNGCDGAGIGASIENNVALVQVDVQDGEGHFVPTAKPMIRFEILSSEGSAPASIVGVGNGDPSSHEPDRAQQRSAFAGSAVAVVQVPVSDEEEEGEDGVEAEEIVVRASADGLVAAEIRIPRLARAGSRSNTIHSSTTSSSKNKASSRGPRVLAVELQGLLQQLVT